MAYTDKAEKISVTLPPEMLAAIKEKVQSGMYGSTSEVIRDAMRLWQREEEEREARLTSIRTRLDRAAGSGDPVPLEEALARIDALHRQHPATTDQ